MAGERFDFHIHTRCSDGARAPAEALALACRAGLTGVSLTDHDTIDAYAGLGAPEPGSPRVLPGLEVSTSIEGVEVHILGYFPGGFPAGVSALVLRLLSERGRRMREGIKMLARRGIEIAWKDVVAEACGRVVSRGHLAQVLVKKRYVSSISAAFPDLLGPEVIRPPGIEAREIIPEIRRLGGVAVWAHPVAEQVEQFLDGLCEAGLQGIEVHTARRRAREREKIVRRIEGRNLFVSGGSDWHGHEDEPLGRFTVRPEQVGDFLRAIGWAAG